ncbi:MAG TPA: c-type cytochrome [Acidiferrobacteraceae bacterium]|nr:c-type cytochrome [Acidiferrobacteraceae bacterium]HEX19553.1 c-type cytochrome [Acidiferrobacteraceae bacterium]
MKRLAVTLVLLVLVLIVGCTERKETPADTTVTGYPPITTDIKVGKVVAASCAKCHGLDGKSTGPEIPHLAAQNLRYLIFVLQAYKKRTRGSTPMQATTTPLTETDIVNVAGYYASLRPIKSTGKTLAARTPVPTTVTPGTAVAAGKVAAAACGGCHGATGQSPTKGTPHLAGQDAPYLATAIKMYREGSRKHPVMQAAVAALSAKDIENLAAYYSVQKPKMPKPRRMFSTKEWVKRCDRCHEPSIENPLYTFPKIRGQPAAYIAKALRTYQEENLRTSSMMHVMTMPLTEEEIQGIAAYYARQQAR